MQLWMLSRDFAEVVRVAPLIVHIPRQEERKEAKKRKKKRVFFVSRNVSPNFVSPTLVLDGFSRVASRNEGPRRGLNALRTYDDGQLERLRLQRISERIQRGQVPRGDNRSS